MTTQEMNVCASLSYSRLCLNKLLLVFSFPIKKIVQHTGIRDYVDWWFRMSVILHTAIWIGSAAKGEDWQRLFSSR